jgi:hypothetical protein
MTNTPRRLSEATRAVWRFVRVDQKDFDSGKLTALSQLINESE